MSASLFLPAENTAAYLKMGIMGAPGSGKTYTAVDVAIGMVQTMRAKKMPQGNKPIYFLDSDGGSSWMIARCKKAGVELRIARTKSFADLLPCLLDAEKNGSVLIIDSISAFAEEFEASYTVRKNRKRGLEFADHAFLKREWRQNFTEPFLNSSLHVIMCGRLGFEYDSYTDEMGKKQIEKTGVKIQAIGQMAYEPHLVLLMEALQSETAGAKKGRKRSISHKGTVIKDRRSDDKSLNGATFVNPVYKNFAPHIEMLNLGGEQVGVDTSRNSDHLIETEKGRDGERIQREVCLEEIQGLMVSHFPGQSAADKQSKMALLQKHFSTRSWVECEKLISLEMLRAGYDAMHRDLEGRASRYGTSYNLPPSKADEPDEIPSFDTPVVEGKYAVKAMAKVNGGAVAS